MKLTHIILLSALTLATSPRLSTEVDLKVLNSEAIQLVKQFGGTLKPQLKKAMKSSGPVEAINVCSKQAPAIAKQISEESGWNVSRVSLKTRNASATPDAWEAKVLQQFDIRQAKGEPAKGMAFSEIVDGKFRFMKAQGVEPLCLTCHGTTLNDEVNEALKLHYSNDKATGYSLGQIRGAFSLTKDL